MAVPGPRAPGSSAAPTPLGARRQPAREAQPEPVAPGATTLDPLALEEALVAILADAVRQHGVEGPW